MGKENMKDDPNAQVSSPETFHNLTDESKSMIRDLNAKICSLEIALKTEEDNSKQIQSKLCEASEAMMLKEEFVTDLRAHHDKKLLQKEEEINNCKSQIAALRNGCNENRLSLESKIELIEPAIEELQKQTKDYRKRIEN